MVGRPGRRALESRLPTLRAELDAQFVVANGENIADGVGITPKLADVMLAAGVDVVTLGNHVWRRQEIVPYLNGSERVVRPANLMTNAPGSGLAIATASDGTRVAVINLIGQLFLDTPRNPWDVVDDLVAEARRETNVVFVDFHGEATSEKVAMAWYLDGKVTAVVGTHTHVQTNDARVLPGGTAALSDAGMTGPHESVIGVQVELAVRRMRTGLPVRFDTAAGGVRIEGALVECDPESGRAHSIETVRVGVE